MRDRVLLLFLGLASAIWIVPRLGFGALANATLDPSTSLGSQSALVLYQLGIWMLMAAFVLAATVLMARSLGLRGWRAVATALVSTGLWALVAFGLNWLVSLAPLGLQVWALSELGTITTALIRAGIAVGLALFVGLASRRAGTRRTSAST